MPLTFEEFKTIVAPYAGRSGKQADTELVARFARTVMESMLYAGSNAGVRKVEILACRGRIALPHEVETPIKVRINRRVSHVWSKWVSFQSVQESFEKCPRAENIIEDTGEFSPLAYPLPPGGSYVGVSATCEEDVDARAVASGEDPTGREIFTTFESEPVVGEKFRLVKNQIRHGAIYFGKITGFVKPVTKGYVVLHAVGQDGNIRQFLGDYSPAETKPMYRVWCLTSNSLSKDIVHLSMLARVRIKDHYFDNELTLFDNSFAVQMAAQRIQGEVNNDIQVADYKNKAVIDLLEKEAGYKKTPSASVDVYFPLSGGAIKNIF